jgi:hypothetical protein
VQRRRRRRDTFELPLGGGGCTASSTPPAPMRDAARRPASSRLANQRHISERCPSERSRVTARAGALSTLSKSGSFVDTTCSKIAPKPPWRPSPNGWELRPDKAP